MGGGFRVRLKLRLVPTADVRRGKCPTFTWPCMTTTNVVRVTITDGSRQQQLATLLCTRQLTHV